MPRRTLPRVLFILKRRAGYGYASGFSSGLYNSAKFAEVMLFKAGYDARLVEVTDNNFIDREVTLFRPDVVIVEALWVVPEKFEVLRRLHPHLEWIARVHREAAFLAQEGIAVDWIYRYFHTPNVTVAMNSAEGVAEMEPLLGMKPLLLPTYYPAPKHPLYKKRFKGDTIDIACMGAVRVLKNHLIQALAAIRFADENELKLRFHINMTRLEVDGGGPYKSIHQLFRVTDHTLI